MGCANPANVVITVRNTTEQKHLTAASSTDGNVNFFPHRLWNPKKKIVAVVFLGVKVCSQLWRVQNYNFEAVKVK